MLRDGLRYILEAQPDMRVIGEAADERTAVEQIARVCPDVVVMDIAMPSLNGIDATRHIHDACPAIEIVILSIHASSEHIFRALQAGARGYVSKESAGKEVLQAVRAAHTSRRYLSAAITETVIEDYLRQAASDSPLERLSQREREVLQLVAEGKFSAAIAATLHLSPKTVETYRSRLMQKLGLTTFADLIKFAVQHGLTPLE